MPTGGFSPASTSSRLGRAVRLLAFLVGVLARADALVGDVLRPAARCHSPRRSSCAPSGAAGSVRHPRPRRLAIWCSGVTSSRIQNERPWVATTRSSSLMIRSCTGTTGKLPPSRCQLPAVVERDVDAGLGAGVEQARPVRVLADDAGELVRPECRW